MARLYRPHIPLAVRVNVASRQLDQRDARGRVRSPRPSKSWTLKHQLSFLLDILAESMLCEPKALRLDHDPPLGARPRTGEGEWTIYDPPANDPEHLSYRPHGAQHAGSHDIKTRVRGEHGQYSDLALIKRARRRERGPKPKRGFTSKPAAKVRRPKQKSRWAKRPFPKRRKP